MIIVSVLALIVTIVLVVFHFNLMVDIRRLLSRMVELQQIDIAPAAHSLAATKEQFPGSRSAQVVQPLYHGPTKISEIGAGETYIMPNGVRVKVISFQRSGLLIEKEGGAQETLQPVNIAERKTDWSFMISKA